MNIFLTLPVGQSLRDFLVLGIVDHLLGILPEAQLVLLTPAYKVKEFIDLCPKHARLHIRRMETPIGNGNNQRLASYRRQIKNRTLLKIMIGIEVRHYTPPDYLLETFREFPPTLVVNTHPMPSYDYDVVMTARKLGIQTAGVVKSWDNVGKGLTSRPHLLSVWNPVNRDEAINLRGYLPDEVSINGAPSFDAYYDTRWISSRDEFLQTMGIPQDRPVITFATCGAYNRGYYGGDETFLADDLLRMISESSELRNAQLVIRLHPASRLESFWRFYGKKGVYFSFASYLAGVGWFPNREDLVQQANLLKHSDVIVTPASSWGIESAIFNTPAVVPVYSDNQPLHAKAQFDDYTLRRHYRPLVENDWVPICRSYEETCLAIVNALTHPEMYSAGRKAIVDNYVYYRDANSSQRVADWIAQIAQSASLGGFQGI